jgi:HK97 family phage major capsid protein
MKDLQKLYEKRKKLVHDAREILNLSETENRDLTADEKARWNTANDDIEKLNEKISMVERQSQHENSLGQPNELRTGMQDRGGAGEGGENAEVRDLMIAHVRNYITGSESTSEQRDAYRDFIKRNQQAGEAAKGGNIVLEETLTGRVLEKVKDYTFMRDPAKVVIETVLNAQKLGAPTLETDPSDPDWTTELLMGDVDTSMAFGKRELEPSKLAKRLKISNRLLQLATGKNPVDRIVDRLGYKFGIAMEKGSMTGDGDGVPVGVFYAAASAGQGITTARDISLDNLPTSVTFDGLINAQYALRAAVRNGAEWLFHRTVLRDIRKLKDDNDQYIWQAATIPGTPSTLLGDPVLESEYAPNTMTPEAYVGIYMNRAYYMWADGSIMTLKRMDELYDATDEVGFHARIWSDGMPIFEEAFARVTLGEAT